MSKPSRSFNVQQRNDSATFMLTLNPSSGLPPRVCAEWQRKSFAHFPDDLALYREPETMTAAENAAVAFILYLKNQLMIGTATVSTENIKVGPWLERFISLDNNPRAARIMMEGSPYSAETIELYREKYVRYIKGDPFCGLKMAEIEQTDVLAFSGRLGLKEKVKSRGGGIIAGTRTYEIAIRFIRMAFKEYGTTHENWRNPFERIKAPKARQAREPDILEENEFRKLFKPGIIPDPLDRALAAAMFWGGLRRGEIIGLKPEDLDWRIPRIIIRHAWQRYDNPEARSLGDPKWHKIREIPFPRQLQAAIRELWASYGEHEFVFCDAKGGLPGAKYMQRKLPYWLKAAGIDLGGRRIVPHGSRHSLASALEDDGVPLRQIQDMLGHSDLKTTKRYLHDTADHINKMGKKIEKMGQSDESQDGGIYRATGSG